jgi:hypothetical protein
MKLPRGAALCAIGMAFERSIEDFRPSKASGNTSDTPSGGELLIVPQVWQGLLERRSSGWKTHRFARWAVYFKTFGKKFVFTANLALK